MQFNTVTFQFKGEKELFDIFRRAYAELTFQSGKLITKSQKGIKEIFIRKSAN